MARESCNLDKEEAEIPKPSSPSPPSPTSPPPASAAATAAASPPSLFLKPPPEPPIQRPGRPETSADGRAAAFRGQRRRSEERGIAPQARSASRCSTCRRRVGLTGFRCRCGDLFCLRHRYSDTHDCSFDYKAAGREEISKANPVIRPAKIIKI